MLATRDYQGKEGAKLREIYQRRDASWNTFDIENAIREFLGNTHSR